MAHVVLHLSMEQMEKLKSYYDPFLRENKPAGSIFVAKLPDCTITAYRTGKVLFQGKAAEKEASVWQSDSTDRSEKQKKQHNWLPPASIQNESVIGSDEVGTGDYFGPITVAAAFVSREQIPLLTELGVKDSKTLSDASIITIAKQLISIIPYSLLTLHNEKYNELQEAGMNQGKMKAMLHNRAIINVMNKIERKHDSILIDQFTEPEQYFRYLQSDQNVVKDVYFATNAEQLHISVAAASILARYRFLQEIDALSKKCGMPLPKGAGNPVDKTAAKLIIEKGENLLRQCAKLHFANTEKAKKLANRMRNHSSD